jgi:hypothetical protein
MSVDRTNVTKRIHLKTKYSDEDGEVSFGKYRDGQLALLFAPDTGEPEWALSMNLGGHGLIAPEDHVYIGGYSEHVGIASCLQDQGVAELAEEIIFGPYDTPAYLMRVLI